MATKLISRSRNSRLTRLLPAIVLAAVILLFFRRLIVGNLILARGDTFLYFYPYWQAAAEALKAGRMPLWNPYLFMGVPFLANSQVGFFYPLNWPLWLVFSTPYAVSASIVLHLGIAGTGAYLAGRRCLSLSPSGSLLAAILFSLGGYLTAQVEHINQLQGLAWLPWAFAVTCLWGPRNTERRGFIKLSVALSIILCLQLLAGHMQTTFITVSGLGIWVLACCFSDPIILANWQRRQVGPIVARMVLYLMPLVLALGLAMVLAAVQLVPSLELAQLSGRGGGLSFTEVVSFSLNPLLLTKSLLAHFDKPLFSEYVGFIPLSALFLALVAVGQVRINRKTALAMLLVIVGLTLALGLFTPVYHVLARLPVFNLFRVPARWLALYAFGMALLAGAGFDHIAAGSPSTEGERPKLPSLRPLVVIALILLAFMFWDYLSVPLTELMPVGPESTVNWPSAVTLAGWGVELAWTILLLAVLRRGGKARVAALVLLLLTVVFSLYFASRRLPYNQPTTPEAYFDLRPPQARLIANNRCGAVKAICRIPGSRFLSMSGILFDVGDQAEIDTIYADQLSESARYDYTIAIKHKEVIGPNLGMALELASVDGFDGGILPLRSYVELSSLLLENNQQSTDGRLREYLSTIPDDHWLDLFDAGYLITDKVGDVWREEVFFDLQHPQVLDQLQPSATVGYIPQFEATELWLVGDGGPGEVQIGVADGSTLILKPERLDEGLFRVAWSEPVQPSSIKLMRCDAQRERCQDDWLVSGLTLVNEKDKTFRPLVLGNYRLIHSGDVKIYENLDVLPRAFLVQDWEYQPTLAASLAVMQEQDFDPATFAVILGEGRQQIGSDGLGDARIVTYEPERMVVLTDSEFDSLLVVSDAYYPGWQVSVDGKLASILQVNGYFRGVEVQAGRHEVELTYVPLSYSIGRLVSAAGLLFLLISGLYAFRQARSQGSNRLFES